MGDEDDRQKTARNLKHGSVYLLHGLQPNVGVMRAPPLSLSMVG